MSQTWTTPVGATLTRDERGQLYGAALYGGIEPSASTPNVFVYSDPASGAAYGYNFDGWDDTGEAFYYTGEGTEGAQLMREGNAAILHHQEHGRALRVFVADGLVAGTRTKIHRYIGEFQIDAERPVRTEEAPDKNGKLRTVFVFRLIPVGEVLRRAEDRSEGGTPPVTPALDLIDPEAHSASEFTTPGTEPSTATRREGELVERYTAHLRSLGHTVHRWKIRPPGEVRPLFTDIYDAHDHELYEAKGDADRQAVREAIGQLFDYRRPIEADHPGLRLTVLLPKAPRQDLLNLLHNLEIACTYETEQLGHFRRNDP